MQLARSNYHRNVTLGSATDLGRAEHESPLDLVVLDNLAARHLPDLALAPIAREARDATEPGRLDPEDVRARRCLFDEREGVGASRGAVILGERTRAGRAQELAKKH